ncbi:3-deoxy-D-manno-octulosonic acid transferase [Phaeobacter marinintestinus]|uniref:3-deoxy-D-manno-octulosonic acid transferase n=1 Tax=Falsiphaeobacter marinintestinus TaxID=1492905 RepID=UPI0011B6F1C9|nr:glycosyltransferase N-terminal domain-containing protein [Phaeobacter marinintestinus]
MPRSIGLAAYRALSWRSAPATVDTDTPRPPGQLLWCHATSAARIGPLQDLGNRIFAQRPDLNQLITCGAGVETVRSGVHGDLVVSLESDHPAVVRKFLDHWQPDLCLWTGADWMPNLITSAADLGVGMFLADLGDADLAARPRWMPDLTRACLGCFEELLVNDQGATGQLRRLGIPARKVSVHSPLHRDPNPPPCSEALLADATGKLSGRPLWLASEISPDEFDAILSAHRDALRFQYRLLLVIAPADCQNCGNVTALLDKTGLSFCKWAPGDPISSEMQVLIIDRAHLGLWYRLSPLTFMGGSLSPGKGGNDPLEASALGSAVLYGPHVPNHLDTYMRLTTEGGARIVRSSAGLAASVVDLVSPEKAAKMALAGWQVVTESAGLIDLLTEKIQDHLDQKELIDARS